MSLDYQAFDADNPYYEDDLIAVRDVIGAERILFGSDFRHGFADSEIRLIMRENALALSKP